MQDLFSGKFQSKGTITELYDVNQKIKIVKVFEGKAGMVSLNGALLHPQQSQTDELEMFEVETQVND